MVFTVKLAGIPVRIESVYPAIHEMCRDYLCGEEAAFSVISTEEKILREWERNGSGEGTSHLSSAYMETLSIYREISEQMVDRDVLLYHGSAVEVDGFCYLFAASSGTGKSTHTRLWREVLPEYGHEVRMVNDDKPLLKFADEGILACGTPWNGKHHLGNNIMRPLKAVCFLSRGESSRIAPVKGTSAFIHLMKYCYRPEDPQRFLHMLTLLERLEQTVRLYELECNMDRDAALVSFAGMQSGSAKERMKE